ncbi:MAG: penicillin acylase family protein [Dehalococcoidia bacterium]
MPLDWSRGLDAARLAAGVARATYITLRKAAHPVEDGTLGVAGLDGAVDVLRDHYGVPHIVATTERDVFFGQGFVHAQDRLFQMDAMRHAAAGRISEWAGRAGLEADRFMRRLGFVDIAGRDLAATGDEQRDLLFAYARGVNAAVRTLPALPPEYAVLGTKPDPWHPEHSMLLGRFVLFSFAVNWDTELLRERVLRGLGPRRAALIDSAYPEHAYASAGVPIVPAAERLLGAYEAALEAGLDVDGASNAWAVTARRTTTGAPLLASDPHLESRMPGLLHVSHIRGGRFDCIGAGVAGVPGIAMGHSRDVAWGITAGLADVSDCYVESVDPADPTRYLTPEGWRTGRTRVERIRVRGGRTVEERVLETRHGPVIGPAVRGENRAVALRSTALEPGDPLGPVLDLTRATTVEEFDAAVGRRPGVPFNYVYAARDGRIGYRMSGRIPRREHGEGLLPQDGARSPGPPPCLDPEDMPRLLDPAIGFVANANNAPGGAHELGADWCEPWRVERVVALLEATPAHSIASFQAIQTDVHSSALARFRDFLIDALPPEDDTRRFLAAWDGTLSVDSAPAALVARTYQHLARGLATRLVGPHAPTALGSGLGVIGGGSFGYRLQGTVLTALASPEPPRFAGAADRDRALRSALQGALHSLESELGPARSRWRWGDVHRWPLPHLLEHVPGLGRRYSRGPYPLPGDGNTVLQTAYNLGARAGRVTVLPGYRQVIDLADFDRSVFQLATGNSGIPGHPRYDDCIEEFVAGRYRPLLYSPEAIEAAAEHRLRLEPA